MLKVIESNCTGCEICVDKCPFKALSMVDDLAVVNMKICTLCGICLEHCDYNALEMATVQKRKTDLNLSEYNGVWVFAEQRSNELMNVSLELVNEASKLAEKRNAQVAAVLLGSDVRNCARELIAHGAETVYIIEDKELMHYRTGPYTRVITSLISHGKPEIFLLGATHNGRDLGPRLAARLDTGLTADCTKLDIDADRKILLQTRPAFGGNLMAKIVCPEHRPQMATVRPGVMEKRPPDYSFAGEIDEIDITLGQEKLSFDEEAGKNRIINVKTKFSLADVFASIKEVVKSKRKVVNLEEAEVIVSGGRGIGSPDNFDIIRSLAKVLNGEVGASRAVVDEGWIDKEHQVGQTGKTVKPTVYIACGISGAIQHKAGMKDSDFIIAINKDKEAPIFDLCDYGIVGDLHDVIPFFIKVLKEEQS